VRGRALGPGVPPEGTQHPLRHAEREGAAVLVPRPVEGAEHRPEDPPVPALLEQEPPPAIALRPGHFMVEHGGAVVRRGPDVVVVLQEPRGQQRRRAVPGDDGPLQREPGALPGRTSSRRSAMSATRFGPADRRKAAEGFKLRALAIDDPRRVGGTRTRTGLRMAGKAARCGRSWTTRDTPATRSSGAGRSTKHCLIQRTLLRDTWCGSGALPLIASCARECRLIRRSSPWRRSRKGSFCGALSPRVGWRRHVRLSGAAGRPRGRTCCVVWSDVECAAGRCKGPRSGRTPTIAALRARWRPAR